jgi:hypothetical protein
MIPPRADADGPCAAGDVTHHDRCGRTGYARHVVVFGHPISAMAQPFGLAGEIEADVQRLRRRAAFDDGGEIEDGERSHSLYI